MLQMTFPSIAKHHEGKNRSVSIAAAIGKRRGSGLQEYAEALARGRGTQWEGEAVEARDNKFFDTFSFSFRKDILASSQTPDELIILSWRAL